MASSAIRKAIPATRLIPESEPSLLPVLAILGSIGAGRSDRLRQSLGQIRLVRRVQQAAAIGGRIVDKLATRCIFLFY